jgi:hypothetical protein
MLSYLKRKVTGLHNPMGGGSSGGGGSSTTVQEIPAELKPLASRYSQEGLEMFDTPFQGYNQQRYEGLNPTQYASLGMTANRALGGSQTFDNAESNLNQMMSGGQNPYLDDMYNKAARGVTSNYQNAAMGSGSFGNSGLGEQLATGLGDLATGMYGGAYESDQARRMQAIGMAPQFANQAYTDASQLMGAGQTMQDQAQQQQDFNYEEFMRQQNDPYQKMAAAAGVFGTNLGGSSKTESTQSGGGK